MRNRTHTTERHPLFGKSLPALPSPPRKPVFDAPDTLSTHILPAAYLRTTRLVPEPPSPPPNASKEERKRILAEAQRQLTALRTSKVTEGYPSLLWNCVNRYVKNGLNESNRTGITLFFAHANGFPKEFGNLPLTFCWLHPPRVLSTRCGAGNLFNMGMQLYLTRAHGVWDLDHISIQLTVHRLQTFYRPICLAFLTRKRTDEPRMGTRTEIMLLWGIVTADVSPAHLYPTLFSALILLDPVIAKPFEHEPKGATAALNRRESWPPREEALPSFKQNPFFQVWDPAVIDVYVDCGTYPTKDASDKQIAKLKVSSMQEAVVFSEAHTQNEVFQRMVTLDERIPLRWVMPGRPGAPEIGGPWSVEVPGVVRPANSSNCRIKGAGHLIPQEAPQDLAQELSRYLLYLFSTLTPYQKANL
ncbi:hypothetical protein NLJ89_g6975 [Agrocybe chaxingu]|uniref:Uncharacterized protein n=1 Tax=Agrocybe chaxingu TaxID=84603 RepID=A0A9W8JY39_9AGAR|nr:hypothetical protein NLJ89_g6975 [Agrocybe chaxingu]